MPVPENIHSIPHFFILGRTRSGTTMLRSMFDAHPNVTIPPEFPVLASVKSLKHKEWNVQTIDQFVGLAEANRKFANMALTPDEIKEALLAELNKNNFLSLNLAVKITNSLYKSAFQKEIVMAIGDKNPLYSLYPHKIRQFFPDAKFIFLRRHLFSVVDSVRKTNFELHWPAVIALKWKKAWKRALREIKKHPDLCVCARYEDIVSDPEAELKQLCDFIGIPFQAQMLAFNDPEKLSDIYGDALESAHKSLLTEVRSTVLPVWNSAPLRRHRIAAAWAGKALTEAGYDRISVPCRWYYYLLGLPSVFFFRLFWLAALSLRSITGSERFTNVQMKLALRLYGTK